MIFFNKFFMLTFSEMMSCSLSIETRSCSIVSRKRMVTQLSTNVS